MLVQKNEFTKTYFSESGFFKSLEKRAEITSDFKQKFFRQLTANCVSRVQKSNLRSPKDLNKKIRSGAISEPERKNVGLSEKLFKMLTRTAPYISRGSFWRECIDVIVWYSLLFADFEKKISALSQIYRQGHENCILGVQRSSLRK